MSDATVLRPTLRTSDGPGRPEAVILMLHGGKEHSDLPVGRSASWLRSAAMMRSITRRAHTAGVGVWLLRYRERGWNGGVGPVEDARWALDRIREHHGAVPVVLLGHSMGARTAIHVADDSSVVGVVALAPWFPADEPVAALAGKHLLAAHGHADEITSFRATAAYVDRARSVAGSTRLQDMGRVGHYMFKHAREWNDVAIGSALDQLGLGLPSAVPAQRLPATERPSDKAPRTQS